MILVSVDHIIIRLMLTTRRGSWYSSCFDVKLFDQLRKWGVVRMCYIVMSAAELHLIGPWLYSVTSTR